MRRKNVKIKMLAATTCAMLALTGCAGDTSKEKGTEVSNETTVKVENETTKNDLWEMVAVKPTNTAEVNVPYAYKDALEGTADIVHGDSKVKFADYLKGEEYDSYNMGVMDKYPTYITSYAVIDMDNDGCEEIVMELSAFTRSYLILHYEDGNVYGYDPIFWSEFDLPKVGGMYKVNTHNTVKIMGLEFEKEIIKKNVLAEENSEKKKTRYYVDGVKCEETEYKEFYNQYESSEYVTTYPLVSNVVLEEMADNGSLYICDYFEGSYGTGKGWDDRHFEVDLNGDGKNEVIDVMLQINNEFEIYDNEFKILINEKEVFNNNISEFTIKVIDIDSGDSEYELVMYGTENNDMGYYGVYRYTEEGIVNLNENIGDDHMNLYMEGDGIVQTIYDGFFAEIGSANVVEKYEYKNGKLEKVENGEKIYDLYKVSSSHEYTLQKDVVVYDKYDCEKEVTTIKAGEVITIGKIRTEDPIDYNFNIIYADSAEVYVDGESVGWIDINNKDCEWGKGIFTEESIPGWD